MGDGEYWHNGLRQSLKLTLSRMEQIPSQVTLNFNIDGLPISRSSRNEFWPILCSIADMPHISPMTIGIYYGQGKPNSVMLFVTELKEILVFPSILILLLLKLTVSYAIRQLDVS